MRRVATVTYHCDYLVRLSTFGLRTDGRGPFVGLWTSREAVVTGSRRSCSQGNSGSVCTLAFPGRSLADESPSSTDDPLFNPKPPAATSAYKSLELAALARFGEN